jgi:excisionase family DNA binding protein
MTELTKINSSPYRVEETGMSLLTKKWLTGDEILHLLGISKRTLQNYRDQRLIPFYQIGRKIFYKSSDVDNFLERHHIRAGYQNGGVL